MKVEPKTDEKEIKFGQSKSDGLDPSTKKWWKMDDDAAAQCIQGHIRFWYGDQTDRTTNFIEFARTYSNMPAQQFMGSNTTGMNGERDAGQFTDNAVGRGVDTLVAYIGRNTIRPDFATTGGDWTATHQAEQLNMFSDGISYECDSDKKAEHAIQDSGIWGSAFIYIGAEHGRVVQERALPLEIWVDEVEAQLGKVMQLHWTWQCDRDRLIAMYPDAEDDILRASQVDIYVTERPTLSDMVGVIYSWRLPSHPKADDGCFIASIKTSAGAKVLKRTKWDRPHFPFARLDYSDRPLNKFWAQGAVEQCRGLQEELDFLHWVMQDAYYLIHTVQLWYKTGSGFVPDHANNHIANMWTSEEPPQFLMAERIVAPEILQRMAIIPDQIMAQLGLNQLQAMGQTAAGPDASGEGIRVRNDTGAIRLSHFAKAYERFRMDMAKLSILALPEAIEQGGSNSYKVTVPNRESLEVIDWADIKLKDMDGFRVRCFPTSSLPQDISGRLDTAQELAQLGVITPDKFLDILNMPDIQRVMNLNSAGHRWITRCLDKIVNDDEYTDPEPLDNLPLAMEMGKAYYQKAKDSSVDEKKLANLRKWCEATRLLIEASKPPPPPAPALAKPAAPPISPLLPNAPPPGQ